MDLPDFLVAVFAGAISSILIVGYAYSETERKKFNQYINNLFDEIDFNRKKLPNYSTYLLEVKKDWEEDHKNLRWIDHNVISVGYGNFLYNFFKFNAYNNFIGTGLNLYLDSDLDYSLKLFYYENKHFCSATQKIEEQIEADHNQYSNFQILKGFGKIEEEFNNISSIFETNHIFSGENRQQFQIPWIGWHIERIRKINGCYMESRLSLLKKFLLPYGYESGLYWGLSIFSLAMICIGSYLLLNGAPFSSTPSTFSLINSGGFFIMSLGLALLLFVINRHSAIGSRKQMEEIIKLLKRERS